MLAHMGYEESVLMPKLHPSDASVLLAEHDRYRRLIKKGVPIPQAHLELHEALEERLYSELPATTH